MMSRTAKVPISLLENIIWLLDELGVYNCGRDCEHALDNTLRNMKMNAQKIELREYCRQILYEDYEKHEQKKALRK